jgi:hypothetical protein
MRCRVSRTSLQKFVEVLATLNVPILEKDALAFLNLDNMPNIHFHPIEGINFVIKA